LFPYAQQARYWVWTSGLANKRNLEMNEIGWWSYWANVHWIGTGSYIMLSSEFDEFFFNRAGFANCEGTAEFIPKIEAEFGAFGVPPCLSVQEACTQTLQVLESRGYTIFDKMSVMQMDHPMFQTAQGLTVLSGQDISPGDWAEAYSLSFYGDTRWKKSVSLIAGQLQKEPSVTLFAGKKDGRVVGTLAAYRTPGLLGIYCVGTIAEYREMGIAGSLIYQASNLASAERRAFILQTILSDGVDDFYSKGGFRRLYLKLLMRRGTPSLNLHGRRLD